jgi:hypothetical protein
MIFEWDKDDGCFYVFKQFKTDDYYCIGCISAQPFDYVFVPNTDFFTLAEMQEIADYMKYLVKSQ